MAKPMHPSAARLLLATKRRLKQRPRELSLSELAEAIGVTHDWLRSFSAGRIAEPGVNKIVALYEALGGTLDLSE